MHNPTPKYITVHTIITETMRDNLVIGIDIVGPERLILRRCRGAVDLLLSIPFSCPFLQLSDL